MTLNLNKYCKKKRSLLKLICVHWKIYQRKNYYKYKKLNQVKQENITAEIEQHNKEVDEYWKEKSRDLGDNLADGCAGCFPLIIGLVILTLVMKSIIWAWHIHWLFGILLLLFFLRLL